MADAIPDIRKKRGRPAIGSTGIMVKLPPHQLAALDDWIAKQPDPRPSRPEAIRAILAETFEFDHENPEWTDEDFARARPPSELPGHAGLTLTKKGGATPQPDD